MFLLTDGSLFCIVSKILFGTFDFNTELPRVNGLFQGSHVNFEEDIKSNGFYTVDKG